MAITPGGSLNSVPSPQQQTLASNYIDFTSTAAASANWGQQYLPDLMEKEAEVFGNRTVSGFLSQVGAEESMTSDQVVWSEQGRLHLSYTGRINGTGADAGSGATSRIVIGNDIDGNAAGANHGIRTNDTVIVANANGIFKCLVVDTTLNSANVDVAPYDDGGLGTGLLATTAGANDTTILVYGSEFSKAASYPDGGAVATSSDSRGANEPQFTSFTNKPIIMKDFYEVSGSDTARIGWVEVTGEDGTGGYLWYLKAEGETRMRFADYIEMAMIEGVLTRTAANTLVDGATNVLPHTTATTMGDAGTEGLFEAIEQRGNMSSGVTGVNAATDLAEFDAILAEFDNQGAIEENMIFANRATALAMDDMLASMNSYGAGGTSYGVFSNSEDMALNLGFSGFRRGSYDFYKTDWKYLNDKATRGSINAANAANAIRGAFIPAGTSSVYDQQLGKNLKRPFLHVRYRASQTDNRYFKTWVTGSVGAATSALDAMQIHMLSERCLVTQGANNFMLMK